MTRTTPRRRTTLHLSQIRFTDALTFMMSTPSGLCFPELGLPDYPATRAVSGRQFHDHPITDEQPDEVSFQAACRVCRYPMLPVNLHLVEPARQLRDDRTLEPARLVGAHVRTAVRLRVRPNTLDVAAAPRGNPP